MRVKNKQLANELFKAMHILSILKVKLHLIPAISKKAEFKLNFTSKKKGKHIILTISQSFTCLYISFHTISSYKANTKNLYDVVQNEFCICSKNIVCLFEKSVLS